MRSGTVKGTNMSCWFVDGSIVNVIGVHKMDRRLFQRKTPITPNASSSVEIARSKTRFVHLSV